MILKEYQCNILVINVLETGYTFFFSKTNEGRMKEARSSQTGFQTVFCIAKKIICQIAHFSFLSLLSITLFHLFLARYDVTIV